MGEAGTEVYSRSLHGGALNGLEYSLDGADNTDDEDPESSRWIHRDKLERMEHQEMERLGIRIPNSRSGSRANGRSRSRDNHNSSHNRNEQPSLQSRRRAGDVAGEDEEERNWDLRLPEERELQDPYFEQAAGPKSASRIPVSKKSPMPIPNDVIGRDTPMQYGKTANGSANEDSISYPKSRGRSASVKVLGDSNASTIPAPIPRAVPGKRAATDTSPTKKPGPRKTSQPANRTTANQHRTKPRSGSNGTRPVTRSGDFGSGSVSKRPEGDPPWLATMYKPDPRLPPDQQLLPTHAKRLQQEQWEKEGKFGTMYDTQFRPLSDEFGERQPFPAAPPSSDVEAEEEKPEIQSGDQQELPAGWPLPSPASPKSPSLSTGPKSPTLSTGRPGTAGGGGSYSTMPKIASPVKPYASPLPSPLPTQNPMNTMRVPELPIEEKEPEEKKKKKEAGCCCIVM